MNKPLIGCDTESFGGGSWGKTRRVYCICFSDGTSIPLFCATDEIPDDARQTITDKLNNHTVVFTNAAHDLSVLHDCGFDVPSWEDAGLLSYCANPNREAVGEEVHSVAAWGARLGYPKIKMESWDTLHPKLCNNPDAELVNRLVEYCQRDAEISYKTMIALQQEIESAPELRRLCMQQTYELEKAIVPIVMEMTAIGFRINLEVLGALWDDIVPRLTEMETEMAQMVESKIGLLPLGSKKVVKNPQERDDQVFVGEHDGKYIYKSLVPFNPASGAHIAYALQNIYGWKPTVFTNTGVPVTSADVIKNLDYPLCHKLTEYAELTKLFTSFVQPMYNTANENQHTIRPGWKQTGTITGRFSCSNPNFQNLPARSDYGARVREAVCAPLGYRFVSIDLQAIEYRVFAALMADFFWNSVGEIPPDVEFMLNAFCNGEDIHTAMAQLWFGHKPDYEENAKQYRSMGKNVSYGRMFGFGAARASKMMGVSEDEARSIIDTANESNPSFEIFQRYVWDDLMSNDGWGCTYYGRLHYYPDIMLEPSNENNPLIARAKRQGFNARIQGTAADINKMLHLDINFDVDAAKRVGVDTGLGIVPSFDALNVGTVHDELLFIVPESNADAFCSALTAHYHDNWDYLPHCPIDGTATHGTHWKEAK